VRGAGLFIGVEIVADRDTRAPDPELPTGIINTMRDLGVLISSLPGTTASSDPPMLDLLRRRTPRDSSRSWMGADRVHIVRRSSR